MTGSSDYSEHADTAVTAREQLDAAAAVVGSLETVQREVLAALIELWPTAAWLASGARSAKSWLLAYTSLSYQEAHRLESVAELCAAHSELADAVVSGTMAMKRATMLARFVTDERAKFLAQILPSILELNTNTSDDEAFRQALHYWAGRVDEQLAPRKEHPHTLALTPSLFGGGGIQGNSPPPRSQPPAPPSTPGCKTPTPPTPPTGAASANAKLTPSTTCAPHH